MSSNSPFLDNNFSFAEPCTLPLNETAQTTAPLLQNVVIEKLFASSSIEYLKSLKLRNFPEEKLPKFAREIGAYIYFFRVCKIKTSESWIIRRNFKSLIVLDKNLKNEAKKRSQKLKLPALPFKQDKLQDSPIQNLNFFETYLKVALNLPYLQSYESLSLFFEISEVENEGGSRKYKETYVRKRAGGRYNENQLILRCGAFWKCWNKRYMIITAEGVMYSKAHLKADSFIRENLLFDHHFQLKYGKAETGLARGLNLIYSNRILCVEALDTFGFFDLLAALMEAFENSPYILSNRFKSFAPVRENSYCKHYVDGEDYFHDVCDALLSAQSEVFITDWWLSPELFLKRPVSLNRNTYTRLDRILKRIAENGVLIKIIVYNEPKLALTIDSEHTQASLQKMHDNITVLRHPSYILPTFLWSHHEKMIIIDQEVGFMGGLDLCYGRMDNQSHSIFDQSNYENFKNENGEMMISENEEFFPGIDYSNSRKRDFVNVRCFEKPLILKKEVPRMPWHDVGVRIIGEAVTDMSRHFIQYWNFVKFDLEPTVKKKKLFTKDSSKMVAELESTNNINNPNYMDRMKRKWTKFKKDIGISNGNSSIDNKYDKNLQPHNDISLQKDISITNDTNDNTKSDRNNQNTKKNADYFLIQSDFQTQKHPIGKTEYDIYAPKLEKNERNERNNQEEEILIEDNEQIINEYFENNESKETNEKKENNIITDNIALDDVKKNTTKNRIYLKSTATQRISNIYRVEPLSMTRIRSASQCERNRLDDFENHPKFKMLLKEVQQTKFESDEKLDEDFMKTTNELEPEYPIDFVQLNMKTVNQAQEKILKSCTFSKKRVTSKEPTHYEKIKSFFTRDKAEIEKIRRANQKNQFQRKPLNKKEKTSFMGSNSEHKVLFKEDKIKLHHGKKHHESGKVKCQMLRSASLWSLGLKRENYENSIYIAYLALITNAENFIYIENQFFISSLAGSLVKNKIAEAILGRIKRAALERQKFKVIIFMPLLPGFEGEINGENSAVLKVQLHYEFLTLSRGGHSLYEELAKDPNISDPFEYLSIYGLRNHGMMPNNIPATEIIYIHSKLMIVDDLFVIMGSANINDRSMLGKRDSEIAMLIEDSNLIPGKMNGSSCKVSKFAQSLRIKLFMEHFALTSKELEDPLCTETLNLMDSIAKKNSEIYKEVFRCYPDDEIISIGNFEKFCKEAKFNKYEELKNDIKGHAVMFPLKFLKEENLQFRLKNKEYYVPNHNFT